METNTVIVLFALVAGALSWSTTITSLSAVQEASAPKELYLITVKAPGVIALRQD